MSYYLDASFLVSLALDEVHSAGARRWWTFNREESIVAIFAATEVAAALSKAARVGRLTEEQAREALADLDKVRAACDGFVPASATFERAEALVRNFAMKLLAPDALHLASAMDAGAALVTFDARLATAARTIGVAVVVPGEDGA